MRVKLDENLGRRGRQLFADVGHEVATVAEEGLQSASDQKVIEACQAEQRCLVTLDLDFSNPFIFPPERFAGIAVIRLPRRASPDDLHVAVQTLISSLARDSILGKLWIVERHRIREYLPETDPDEGARE